MKDTFLGSGEFHRFVLLQREFEAPDWERLYERREAYPVGIVPAGGLFLTAGVDVQRDRLECEVVAWGRNKESWSVDYRVLDGDTAQPEVWRKLDRLLGRDWPHACGTTLPIRLHKGFPKATWEKDPACNNEALDCRVYARAAASIYGLDRFKEIHWKRLEQALGVDARPVADTGPVRPAVPPAAPVKAPRPLPQRATVTADDPYL